MEEDKCLSRTFLPVFATRRKTILRTRHARRRVISRITALSRGTSARNCEWIVSLLNLRYDALGAIVAKRCGFFIKKKIQIDKRIAITFASSTSTRDVSLSISGWRHCFSRHALWRTLASGFYTQHNRNIYFLINGIFRSMKNREWMFFENTTQRDEKTANINFARSFILILRTYFYYISK